MARVVVDVVEERSGTGLASASRDVRSFGGNAQVAGRQSSAAAGGIAKLGGAVKAGLIGAAIAGGAALVKLGGDAITAASDLQQSLGGAQAVFGRDADKIVEASKRAADGLGLSKASYLQLSTVLGAGLKNQGLDDYAGKTQKVIGLGADLAAQFGGSTKDAVEAIGSLMRGESDPIERYGVSINQTAVAAELAARGQDKLTGAAGKQAAAQARLDLLFKQTTAAQGTFARETDTLAGQQARLAANTENLKAKIGSALLPALTSATGYLSRTTQGGTGLSKALAFGGNIIRAQYGPALRAIVTGAKQVYGAIVTAVGGQQKFRSILSNVGRVLLTVAKAMGGTAAGAVRVLVGGILIAIRVVSTIARGISAATGVARSFAAGVATLTGRIRSIPNGQIFTTIRGKVSSLIGIVTSVPGKISAIGSAIGRVPLGPFGSISSAISSISGAASSAIGWLRSLASAIASTPIGRAASAIGGLLRSNDYYAQPGTGSSTTRIVVPVPAPVVNVMVDGAALRAVIRSELRAAVSTQMSRGLA